MGAITFAGEGASSAQNTIDTTAAGDIWDNTFMLIHNQQMQVQC